MKEKLLLLIFFVALLGCTTKKIETYDTNPAITAKVLEAKKSDQPVKLELCKNTSFNWDRIVILPPYSNAESIKKQNLVNSEAIEKMMPELTLDEGKCILLFVENNNIVRYSSVPRVPLDFNEVKVQDQAVMDISREIACSQLYISNSKDNQLSIYIKQ